MRPFLVAVVLTVAAALPAHSNDKSDCLAGVGRLRAQLKARPTPANLDELRRTLRRAEREAGEREYDDCVSILKAGAGGGNEAEIDDDDDDGDEGPETEDMFGFTDGTDILEKGKFELTTEIGGAFGKRGGRYRVGSIFDSFTFAPFDRLSVEIGATYNHFSIRGIPVLDNRNRGGLSGLSSEITYQLVKRVDSAPIGVALIVEPGVGFLDQEAGERGRGVGVETRLAFDTALVPRTVFAGLNLIYEAEQFRPRGRVFFNDEGEEIDSALIGCGSESSSENCPIFSRRAAIKRDSQIGISGALAFQVAQNVFIGAEIRYMRAYEGLGLQKFEGHALSVGPTFYAKLSERFVISASFSTQVAGRSVEEPDRTLDLDNFPRHQAKLKVSYEF
jgi:hypothetical protein